MNAAMLNATEAAVVTALRSGHAIQILPARPLIPSTPTVTGFKAQMLRLTGTSINRSVSSRPAAVINTAKGKRGVFWVGIKDGVLRVGTCLITNGGYLYKRNRFDGSFFQTADSLVQYNS